MATQKILKFVIAIIISTSMIANIQASFIETAIMSTNTSQTSPQQNEPYSAIPWDYRAFTYGVNESWDLLELCLYDEIMIGLRSIQTEIAVSDRQLYISLTGGSLYEGMFEFNQIATDGWLGFEPDIFQDWIATCEYDITPLNIPSSLDDAGFSGTGLYEEDHVVEIVCYVNDFFYDLNTFFEDSEQIVVTYSSEPNLSSATVPEPSTLLFLSFGTLAVIRKKL